MYFKNSKSVIFYPGVDEQEVRQNHRKLLDLMTTDGKLWDERNASSIADAEFNNEFIDAEFYSCNTGLNMATVKNASEIQIIAYRLLLDVGGIGF